MKSIRIACAFLILAAASAAYADPGLVPLPAPKTDGKVSVEKALKHRRSFRAPATAPLSLAEVGQLCWAAQGVTDQKGHRTAPSAMACYPLDLYVLAGNVKGLASGVYHYETAAHALRKVAEDKKSEFLQKAAQQPWIAQAPVLFVVTGTVERMAKIKDRGAQFMAVEVGLAAQGFFLEAESLGLGSTFVGGFDPEAARKVLGLSQSVEVMAVLPVGKK